MLTITQINELSRREFVQVVGWVFEHSPWVAEGVWDARPFADRAAMLDAMTRRVRDASRDDQLALLRAHPDLGARVGMSDASAGEQAGAGLDQLTPDEHARLQVANAAYRQRFGFPFLFAVRGSTLRDVLAALETRLDAAPPQEFETALLQVCRIAAFRLEGVVV
jgi:2-oxo-4-hydroxy-4-carboxy-5-ureidoimidazoline decarboxylase